MLPIEKILGDGGLTVDKDEVRLDVRLPWYRALPLSTIEFEHLTIDGIEVPLEDARFELNGQTWALSELENQTDIFWFVLDSGYVLIPRLRLEQGTSAEVSMSFVMYPPYIPGLRKVTKQSEKFTVQ